LQELKIITSLLLVVRSDGGCVKKYLLIVFCVCTIAICSAQDFMTLDAAIDKATGYLFERIPSGSKVVVFNFNASQPELSNYVIDELTARIVNNAALTVVDRQNLALLQKELNFQLSGEVSDETAVSVGKKLGAQSIISGSISPLGDIYRLHIRAIEVETAKIQGMQNINIMQDPILAALTGRRFSQSQSRWLISQNASSIPDDENFWKRKRLYVGLRPGVSLGFYDTTASVYEGNQAKIGISFDLAAQIAFHFNQFFSFQAELMFTADSMNIPAVESVPDEYGRPLYSYDTTYSYNSASLVIPVLAKISFKPKIFSITGLGGIYFPIFLGKMHYTDSYNQISQDGAATPSGGFTLGGNFGVKTGHGILFADIRYMMDFSSTRFSGGDFTADVYKRSKVSFGVGYEIGFMNF
jgi:TolB-like protein